MIAIYTILTVLVVSLIALIGILTFFIKNNSISKFTTYLVSLSAGTLLGGAFLHIIPEIAEEMGIDSYVWLLILTGILIFFSLEKIIHWRHCHVPTSENHPHPVGKMNLIGDALHNFIDGAAIAGAFMISVPLGFATAVGIIAHEIPQEIADFGVLLHAGYSKKKALLFNFISALTALFGATLVLIIGETFENFVAYLLAITAGGFIYIATADLMPELKKECSWQKSLSQMLIIVAGVLIMLFLKVIE